MAGRCRRCVEPRRQERRREVRRSGRYRSGGSPLYQRLEHGERRHLQGRLGRGWKWWQRRQRVPGVRRWAQRRVGGAGGNGGPGGSGGSGIPLDSKAPVAPAPWPPSARAHGRRGGKCRWTGGAGEGGGVANDGHLSLTSSSFSGDLAGAAAEGSAVPRRPGAPEAAGIPEATEERVRAVRDSPGRGSRVGREARVAPVAPVARAVGQGSSIGGSRRAATATNCTFSDSGATGGAGN